VFYGLIAPTSGLLSPPGGGASPAGRQLTIVGADGCQNPRKDLR
jgi:hypothetical protein